jgi:hypothetical protein
MKLTSIALLAPVLLLAGAAAWAADAPPAKPTAKGVATAPAQALSPAKNGTEGADANEPRIQRIVVEDDGARIDELRVRGQATRIVVSPKRAGAAPYEIITGDGSRDLGFGANTSRGAAGQRVWNVFAF